MLFVIPSSNEFCVAAEMFDDEQLVSGLIVAVPGLMVSCPPKLSVSPLSEQPEESLKS